MIPPFIPHPSGAVWWPEQSLLAITDLHLEKASSRALHGLWLPPYDTAETLKRLEAVLAELQPRRVICLGDTVDDPAAWQRMHPEDHQRLQSLCASTSWTWIAGNHDPDRPPNFSGCFCSEIEIAGVTFRHQARPDCSGREVSGHFHPKARLNLRGRGISGRCFMGSATRLILPAFGAFTGGLDQADEAFKRIFPTPPAIWLIHRHRVYPLGTLRSSSAAIREARASDSGTVRRRRSKK